MHGIFTCHVRGRWRRVSEAKLRSFILGIAPVRHDKNLIAGRKPVDFELSPKLLRVESSDSNGDITSKSKHHTLVTMLTAAEGPEVAVNVDFGDVN